MGALENRQRLLRSSKVKSIMFPGGIPVLLMNGFLTD
jgi:hypothetical protein